MAEGFYYEDYTDEQYPYPYQNTQEYPYSQEQQGEGYGDMSYGENIWPDRSILGGGQFYAKGLDYTAKEDEEKINVGVEADLISAKAQLQRQELEPDRINLYDHFSAVIEKFITEKPEGGGDLFEEFCKTVKKERFLQFSDRLQDMYIPPQFTNSGMILRLLKTVQQLTTPDGNVVTDGNRLKPTQSLNFFEHMGVALPALEMQCIQIKLFNLKETYHLKRYRFWGKICGIYKDYIIAEGEEYEEDIQQYLQEQEDNKKMEEEMRREHQNRIRKLVGIREIPDTLIDVASTILPVTEEPSGRRATNGRLSAAPVVSAELKSTLVKQSTAHKLSTVSQLSAKHGQSVVSNETTEKAQSVSSKPSTVPRSSAATKLSTVPRTSAASKPSTVPKASLASKTPKGSTASTTAKLSQAAKLSAQPRATDRGSMAKRSTQPGQLKETRGKVEKPEEEIEEEPYIGEEFDTLVTRDTLKPPPEFPPLPVSTFEKPHEIHPEKRGEGANKMVYFVCNSIDEEWVRLPDVTPEQIRTARKIRKLFTGYLDTNIITYPVYPGKEIHFLRATIARISATTSVSPKGYYKMEGERKSDGEEEEDDEEEEEEEEEEEGEEAELPKGNLNKPIIENPAYKPKGVQAMLDLKNWVHHEPALLDQGRTIFWTAKQERAAAEGEEMDMIEDDEEEEYDPFKPHKEKAPPLFRPLSKDSCFHIVNKLWTVIVNTTLLPEEAMVALRCDLWPGAYAFASGRNFDYVYIGWGQKYIPFNHSTAWYPVPNVLSEYTHGPEIMEMRDPSWEQEEAWRGAHAPKPRPEGIDEEGGEESSVEGEEEMQEEEEEEDADE